MTDFNVLRDNRLCYETIHSVGFQRRALYFSLGVFPYYAQECAWVFFQEFSSVSDYACQSYCEPIIQQGVLFLPKDASYDETFRCYAHQSERKVTNNLSYANANGNIYVFVFLLFWANVVARITNMVHGMPSTLMDTMPPSIPYLEPHFIGHLIVHK